MSTLRVNKIVNLNDNGPVEFSKGVVLPANQNIEGNVVFNCSGVVTATTFSGSGAGITSLPGVPNGKAIAFTLIV